MNSCPSQFAAVESDCQAFLACEAQCECSDISCEEACAGNLTGSCKTADDALQSCLGSKCTSECHKSSGTQTTNCATLAQCCPTLPTTAVDGCNTVVDANHDSICATELHNYQAATFCGSSSGGAGCSDLSTCCSSITDPQTQMGCQSVVGTGNDTECGQALTGFKAGGFCM
jgi:hypothetical protein